MGVVAAFELEASGWPREVSGCASAAMALELARQLDDERPSAAMKALCAREFRETMAELRLAAEAKAPTSDSLDDLQKARDRRRAKAAG